VLASDSCAEIARIPLALSNSDFVALNADMANIKTSDNYIHKNFSSTLVRLAVAEPAFPNVPFVDLVYLFDAEAGMCVANGRPILDDTTSDEFRPFTKHSLADNLRLWKAKSQFVSLRSQLE